MKHHMPTLLLATLLSTLLAGCARGGNAADAAPVAPPVVVARGQIDIQGGVLALGLPVDGTVVAMLVAEGDSVHRGQPLVQADPTPAQLDLRLAEAKLAQARAQVALLQPKVSATAVRAQRLGQAALDGAADGQSADDARETAAEASAELASAQTGVELAQAELERARYQLSQLTLHAPLDGDVLHVTASQGLHTTAGVPLLTLLPSAARIVRAELSQDTLAQIAIGDVAQVLSDDGRQTPLARATVLRIGRTFGQSSLQADPLQRVNERSVECVLSLDQADALRVGQRVLVRFQRTAAVGVKGG